MRITRVYRFAASHRLHASGLADDENAALYGKCNNPFGHGHNYVLHVSVRGDVAGGTGRIVNVGALDRYVQERVIEPFDHRYMNADLDDFVSSVPTTENLAVAIERRLRSEWDRTFPGVQLDRIFIQETPRNTFELRTA